MTAYVIHYNTDFTVCNETTQRAGDIAQSTDCDSVSVLFELFHLSGIFGHRSVPSVQHVAVLLRQIRLFVSDIFRLGNVRLKIEQSRT